MASSAAAPPAMPSTLPYMAFLEVGEKYKLAFPVMINPNDYMPGLITNDMTPEYIESIPLVQDIRKQQAILDRLAEDYYEVVQVSTLNNEVVAAKFKGLGRRMLGSGYLPDGNRTVFWKEASGGKQTRRRQKKRNQTRKH